MMLLMMAAASIASATIPVQMVDLDTKKPIAAHVIAWDEYFWSGWHSGSWSCFRAAGIVAQPSRSDLVLPAVTSTRAGEYPRHAQAFAFARGYCGVAQNDANGLRAGVPVTIRMRVSGDPPEYRLLYLAQAAQTVAVACGEQADRGFAKGMMDGILDEADSIAKDFHEQFLARRVHEASASLQSLQTQIRVSIFKPMIREHPGWSITERERDLDIGRNGSFKPPWCPDRNCAAGAPPRDTLIPPNPYDVNLRDEDGQTLLMNAAYDVDLPAVKLVLAHGADPGTLDRPGGLSALDMLLLRAEKDVHAGAPDGAELHLLRVANALAAAHGSLHPEHARLLAHPEEWKLDERAHAFWSTLAARVRKLPAREAFQPSCSAPELSQVRTLRLGTPARVSKERPERSTRRPGVAEMRWRQAQGRRTSRSRARGCAVR